MLIFGYCYVVLIASALIGLKFGKLCPAILQFGDASRGGTAEIGEVFAVAAKLPGILAFDEQMQRIAQGKGVLLAKQCCELTFLCRLSLRNVTLT